MSVRGGAVKDARPLVTVVLATCRSSEFLEQALDSVRSQTVDDWELVVVDDGSPDPDWLARSLEQVGRHRLIRQESRGVSSSRNIGCAAAAGEFVTFLDDDDYWPADRLASQLAAVQGGKAVDGCYGNFVYVDEAGAALGAGPDCSSERARLAAGFHTGTLLVRRDAGVRAGWFDPLLPAAEDLDFCLRLTRTATLAYVPEVLLFYRRHSFNVTRRVSHVHGFGQEICEHHYRLARLRGEDASARAIAEQLGANERYFALEHARYAKAYALHGELGPAWDAVGGALVSTRLALRAWRRRLRAVD